jgi:hypothetical protein
MLRKKLDLGEYKITIEYDKETGKLDLRVLDEAGDLIEGILILDIDDDSKIDDELDIDINLN